MSPDLEEFLQSVKVLQLELFRVEDKILRLETQCSKCTASWSLVPGGGTGDPHKDALFIVLAEEKEHRKDLVQKLKAREKLVDSFLNQIKSLRDRYIMKFRYVDLMSQKETQLAISGAGLHCSDRNIRYLLPSIEQEVQELWDKRKDEFIGKD